ncbi:MAG TPA: lytic transglycosylase domain-containing protein [Candidatus Solibacter sp.]|nr:lytic transglycosylase domain-containing protein [Candidatus Solibacter sp.]
MKFAALALFLGCSAFGGRYAVQLREQSEGHSNPAVQNKHSDLRSALESLRFALQAPKAPELMPSLPVAEEAKLTAQIPTLPKSETLVLIAAAAAKHNVPAAFVQSIVAAESNFDCAAMSPKGAIGLMQLMPATAEQFGADDPKIPEQNIDAGTRYLRWLMDRYQHKGKSMQQHVIAAYNAGPGMVDRYHGIPPFRETRTYVTRVLAFFRQFGGTRKGGPFKG